MVDIKYPHLYINCIIAADFLSKVCALHVGFLPVYKRYLSYWLIMNNRYAKNNASWATLCMVCPVYIEGPIQPSAQEHNFC